MLSSGVPAEGCGRESGISLLNVSVSSETTCFTAARVARGASTVLPHPDKTARLADPNSAPGLY